MRRLPTKRGFGQRHFTVRGVTPFLRGTGVEDIITKHRSSVTLSGIREDILKFNNPISIQRLLTQPNFQEAISLTTKAFSLPSKVEMLHLNDVFNYDLNIWSSSPGLPWRELGYSTKREVIDNPLNQQSIRWYWHKVKHQQPVYDNDCCAFVRSHLADPGEEKTRAVWGYPATMTFGEAVFAVPLIEAYRKHNTPIAYGYETATGGLKKLRNESSTFKHFSCIDFKNFDKTIPAELIDIAFAILETNIDFIHYRDYGVADAECNIRMYDYIRNYFIHTPIRLCDGTRYMKSSGVASGSYFTQLIDSVVNHILLVWACLNQFGRPPKFIKVLGDDSYIADVWPLDLEELQHDLTQTGMTVNIRKSIVTTNVDETKFLGFQMNNGLPKKPYDEWVTLLAIPEYPDYTWDEVATRALGLLYANSAVDTDFDYLCRQIISYRPFEVIPNRSMTRMLRVMGVEKLDPNPPDFLGFLSRLRIV